jgi:hypothetical protein
MTFDYEFNVAKNRWEVCITHKDKCLATWCAEDAKPEIILNAMKKIFRAIEEIQK